VTQDRRRARPVFLSSIAFAVAVLVGVACDGPAPLARDPSPFLDESNEPTRIAPSPTAPAPTGPGGAILLLAGRPGAMTLERIEASGKRAPVVLPDPAATWISTDVDGHVLITLADGRAFRADRAAVDSDPDWRPLGGTGRIAATAGALTFGTLSPDGSQAVFVAADYAAGLPAQLVIVDLARGTRSIVALGLAADGAPPAWIGGRVVVLTRGAGDAVGSTIVDPHSGRVIDGPGPAAGAGDGWSDPIAALSIAADGSAVAVASRLDPVPGIRPANSWIAGQPTSAERVELPPETDGSRSFAWLALAASGDVLAVVQTDADGEVAEVTVLRRRQDGATWVVVARIGLPRWPASGGDGLATEDRDLGLFGQHHPEDLLQGKQMDTRVPALEVVAGAVPAPGVEAHVMGVVVTAKREVEAIDRDPIELACVAVRLLDLADQGAVHRPGSSVAPGGAHEAAVRSSTIDR